MHIIPLKVGTRVELLHRVRLAAKEGLSMVLFQKGTRGTLGYDANTYNLTIGINGTAYLICSAYVKSARKIRPRIS